MHFTESHGRTCVYMQINSTRRFKIFVRYNIILCCLDHRQYCAVVINAWVCVCGGGGTNILPLLYSWYITRRVKIAIPPSPRCCTRVRRFSYGIIGIWVGYILVDIGHCCIGYILVNAVLPHYVNRVGLFQLLSAVTAIGQMLYSYRRFVIAPQDLVLYSKMYHNIEFSLIHLWTRKVNSCVWVRINTFFCLLKISSYFHAMFVWLLKVC